MFSGRTFWHTFSYFYFRPLHYFVLAWQYSFIFMFPVYLIFMFLKKAILYLEKYFYQNKTNEKIFYKKYISRKDFLNKLSDTAIDTLPLSVTLGSYGLMLKNKEEFHVTRQQVKINNLHDDLKGFKFTHITDIHIGNIINENYLNNAVKAIESVESDMLIITGDIIDSISHIPLAQKFFYQLKDKFKYGMTAILGNHDFFVDPTLIETGLTKAGINVIRNKNNILNRGNGSINLIGLDYPIEGRRSREKRMLLAKFFFNEAVKDINIEYPSILLNHHPDEFAFLKNENIDLVLAGHTHGGQVSFSKERDSVLSFGNSFYKYYRGLYYENGTHLYVNQGLGHWLPIRLNCPPEVSIIEIS
ncbi:MAG: metallophosphoesterase [Spirochaetia bacterium]|nr:metallophosphoesterase [Spirochaetia bacterium]